MSTPEPNAVVITGIGPMCREATSVEDLRSEGPRAPATAGMYEGDWFEVERYLGTKGYKYLTRPTRYLLAAIGRAVADAQLTEHAYAAGERGVFAGTNFAAHETLASMDRIIMSAGADGLQPMMAPNFSINVVASQASIKHRYQAFNVTLTSAMVAGLEAVLLGADSIRGRRARHVLACAVEDEPPSGAGVLLGSPRAEGGACAIALESIEGARARQAPIIAQIGSGLLRFVGQAGAAPLTPLRRALDAWIDAIAPRLRKPAPFSALAATFPRAREVEDVVRSAFTDRGLPLEHTHTPGDDGAYLATSPLLQFATLATRHGSGVVLATSPQGHVALLSLLEVGS